jgi:uncharacterized protein (DUF58 family)
MPRTAPRVTARGLAVFATFGLVVVIATLTSTPELTPLAVTLGVPLLLGPWMAGRRAQSALATAELHAHVEPGTVEVGGEMQVHLSLTHRTSSGNALPPLGLAPTDNRWTIRGAGSGGDQHRSRLAPSIGSLLALPTPAPGRTETCLLPVRTGRRGVFELPPQPTWATDPFGLFAVTGPPTPAVTAVVHPAPVLPGEHLHDFEAAGTGADASGHSSAGGGIGDLEGIRPYAPGDRLSLLHWSAKARYGTWFVRQFGTEEAQAVSVVIDDRVGVHRRLEFEQLVATTLGILTEAIETGRSAQLHTLSGRRYAFVPGERGQAEARMVLAELQPLGTDAWARMAPAPPDTLLLTTRTGAERLDPRGMAMARAGRPGIGGSGPKVVVV